MSLPAYNTMSTHLNEAGMLMRWHAGDILIRASGELRRERESPGLMSRGPRCKHHVEYHPHPGSAPLKNGQLICSTDRLIASERCGHLRGYMHAGDARGLEYESMGRARLESTDTHTTCSDPRTDAMAVGRLRE